MKRVLLACAAAFSLTMVGCGLGAEDQGSGSTLQSQSQELKTATDGTTVCSSDKVLVCHKDPDDTFNVLCVAASAVDTHIAHGDYVGDCYVDAGTL